MTREELEAENERLKAENKALKSCIKRANVQFDALLALHELALQSIDMYAVLMEPWSKKKGA